jgi:signal transduction histidine kinase
LSLSVLLALFGLELFYATLEELSEKTKMNLRLIQSERLASVGRLAGGVAHEILNPINIISGRAQLLMMEKQLDPRLHKTLEIINEQTKRVASVVNDLRQFSYKPKGGRVILNLHELLDRMLTLLQYELRVNTIDIIKQFHAVCPLVLGANDQLGQGFLNIISDIIDAMPDGGTLTVSTSTIQRRERSYIEIRFSDTGTGVSHDEADKRFDPFYTTDEKRLRTGLGLFVSYGIMRDHDGTTWIDTSAPDGATFVVELPVTDKTEEKNSENDGLSSISNEPTVSRQAT